MTRRSFPAWLPYAFLLSVCAFLFQDLVFHGKAYMGDSDRLFANIPFLTMAARAVAHNRLPLWNDLNLCGYPLGGAGIHAFYPPVILQAKLFSSHIALAESLRLLVEFLLMTWLGYAFFLKVWKDELLAAFSSLAFSLSLSSIMIIDFPFSASYAPFLMLFILWDWPRRALPANILWLAAALALEVLGTNSQVAAYFILFALAVSFARTAASADRRSGLGRLALIWACSGTLALMASTPYIFPFLEAMRASNRVALTYPAAVATLQQPWFSAFRLAFPYFMGDFWQFPGIAGYSNTNDFEFFPAYAGVAALLLCAIALLRLRRRDVWPWAAAIAFLALGAVRSPFAALPYALFLRSPLLHSRIVYLIPLAMAFLAPVGLQVFLSGSKREQWAACAIAGGLTAALFAFGHGSGRFSLLSVVTAQPVGAPADALLARFRDASEVFAAFGFAFTAALVLHRLKLLSGRGLKLACLALLACDLLYFARKHTMKDAFAAESAWHPDNAVATFLRGLPDQDRYRTNFAMGTNWPGLPPFSPAQPNLYQPMLNLDYGFREVNGMGSSIDRHYIDLVTEGRPHEEPMRIPLVWFQLLSEPIADLTAVKYYVVPDRPDFAQALAGYADRIFAGEGAAVYRKRRAVPRWRLACRVKTAASLYDFLSAVRSPSFDPQRDAVIDPAEGAPLKDLSCAGRRELALDGSRPGELIGTSRTDKPSLLVFSETFASGWRARINGVPQPLYRVNYAFQGVVVPAGRSKIELRFTPAHYGLALALSGLALAVLLGLTAYVFLPGMRR